MIASGHGGGRCSPMSASGVGRAAGEPGVSCGRMWGRFLSPILPLSLKCGCSVSSRLAAVASASRARVRLYPAASDGDSTTWVLLRRLCLASAPPCRFRGRFTGRQSCWGVSRRSIWSFVARPLVVPRSSSGVLGPSVGLQFTLLSGVWKTSRSFSVFRGYGSGFLPPTASRSFIGGTSAWSGPLLRVTAVSLAFGLATAVFRCGGGFTHGYGLSPVFLLREWRTATSQYP